MGRAIENQVIVITGASSGIGRCTAKHLATKGARVVVTARRAKALNDLVCEIKALGGVAVAVPGDVTCEEDLRAVADAAVQHFGRIDTWVNNASVYIQGRVQDISLDEYRRILDVNLVGTVNGTQRALEVMLPQGAGVIVQVASVAANRPVPYTSPYSASKAAIEAFTASLRSELWGSGVYFSVLYPPTVDTPIYHNARAKLGVVPRPAPPVADPQEAAEAIEHLARTGERHRYFGWAGPLAALEKISPAAGDWLLHRVVELTYSDTPANPEDNLDSPSSRVPPAVRAGWTEAGWNGLTADDLLRVFPLQTVAGAAAVGFLAARAVRKFHEGGANQAHGRRE